jgi:hypothetical protein
MRWSHERRQRRHTEAAQAVIDRWDTPFWKDIMRLTNTDHYIDAMRIEVNTAKKVGTVNGTPKTDTAYNEMSEDMTRHACNLYLAEIKSYVNKLSVELPVGMLSKNAEDLRELRKQRDRLAEACKLLMRAIGDPNASAEDWWATEDEINAAWNSGSEALAAVEGGSDE